ncbi:MAG: hypothetical protein WCK77_09815 [Verrucomicrobiota bacterium]
MDSNKIKIIIFGVIATFVALYLGISAATAQFEAIAWIVGSTTLIICVLLGRKIWLLIPFLGSLQFTLMIPGRPTTMLVAQLLVVAFSLLMFLARKLPLTLRFTELEFWIALLVGCVMQVYLRNPVGVNLFGSDTVGGRPYALFVVTLIASMILCGLRVPAAELRTAMKLSIIGGLLNLGMGFFGWLLPSFGVWIGVVDMPRDGMQADAGDVTEAGRVDFVTHVPLTLATWVSSFANPIRACFSWRWAPLVLLSFAFAAMSGYRNVAGAVGLTYVVGLFYHGRFLAVLAAGMLSIIGLIFLAVGNLAMPLPPNIQRSLSFLPGTWDQRYLADSKASTDWRVEIWKEVLLTDRWIRNKWLGDGLGYSAEELAMQRSMAARKNIGRLGVSGFDAHREAILSNGDYHSGPVSAIRVIGYFGLLVMGVAQLRLVVHAHRQIMRCKGTEWFPVALFFCIPIVWTPAFFWAVFGGFASDAPALLLAAGMLRMLENNLPLPAYVPAGRRQYELPLQRPAVASAG